MRQPTVRAGWPRPAVPGRQRAIRLPVAAAALATALAAGACGPTAGVAGPSTTATLRPLTIDQAVQLSSTLYEDHRLGGADVTVEVPYTSTITVAMSGTVDFDAHTGHLKVVTDEVDLAPTLQLVDFTESAVYEADGSGEGWTERAPDPTNRPIDRIVQLLVALSSTQRDNPLLVQQSQVRWAGTRLDGGTTVDVYRYSPTVTYWVDHANGRLVRFIAVVDGIAGPVTIDLSDLGAHPSPPPIGTEGPPPGF